MKNDFYLFSSKRSQPLLTNVTLVVFALVAGCSWNSNNNENKEDGFSEEIETSEQKLYKRAQGSLRSSNFRSAIEQLEQLESTISAEEKQKIESERLVKKDEHLIQVAKELRLKEQELKIKEENQNRKRKRSTETHTFKS